MWHREVITEAVERTLKDLQHASAIRNFYLAGVTGLALHVGHQRSLDLDFFSLEPFDPEAILGRIGATPGVVQGEVREGKLQHGAHFEVADLLRGSRERS